MPRDITLQEVRILVATGACALVEALGPAWYDDVHLPGAINLWPAVVRRLAPLQLRDLDRTVVVYCSRWTHEAEIVATALEDLGHRDVRVFAEGKEAWVEANLPVEAQPAEISDRAGMRSRPVTEP